MDDDKMLPTEDLMREHGVLDRVLLIYEEMERRLLTDDDPPLDVLVAAASIIKRFVEDSHEHNEEAQVFPLMDEPGRLPALVATLRKQHDAGRSITLQILTTVRSGWRLEKGDRAALAGKLHDFVRMYRPHKSREDTVLFPALREALSQDQLSALGEKFEKQEKLILGGEIFKQVVAEVAALEKTLGLEDLAQYTPSAISAAGT